MEDKEPAFASQRKLQTLDFDEIRVLIDTKNIVDIDSTTTTYLTETLMSAVEYWIETTVSIVTLNRKLTFTQESCGTANIDTSYRDEGVDADMVLFVQTTLETETFVEGTPCIFSDTSGRTLAGVLNFNPDEISTAVKDYDLQYKHTLREAIHILGFSRSLFTLFKNPDGTQRDDIIEDATIRDVPNRQQIILPEVLEKAQAHFDCDTLQGLDLENQDSLTDAHIYWDRRTMGNDIMTIEVLPNAAVSEMTLGFLEGTGWYLVNYSKADSFAWGKERGCSFLTDPCIEDVVGKPPISDEFCETLNSHGCTADHTHKAICAAKHAPPDPIFTGLYFDYYDNQTISTDWYSDNCPYYIPYDYGNCKETSHDSNEILVDEYYGGDSKCFVHTLTKSSLSDYYHPGNVRGGCFKFDCQTAGDGYRLQIQVGDETVSCPSGTETVGVSGYDGTIVCPDPDEFCNRTLCFLTCKNQGICLDNKCVCNDGYSGEDCSQTICDSGCNDRGVCKVDGTCQCDDGWGGTDCSEQSLVESCDRCDGILDCYGDRCECFPFPGRDCEALIEQYTSAGIIKASLALGLLLIFILM